MALNEKQQKFADFLAMGFTNDAAYRMAFGNTESNANSISACASRLAAMPEIQAWRDLLQERRRSKIDAAYEQVVDGVGEWMHDAGKGKKHPTGLTQIARLIADLRDRDRPKRIEITGRDGGPIELNSLSPEEYEKLKAEAAAAAQPRCPTCHKFVVSGEAHTCS